MAMLLLVTIGGVYATWTYSGTNDITDAYAEAFVTITNAEEVGANGVYKVESNLQLLIDQKPDSNHEAELLYQSTDDKAPYIRVTFTASGAAPVEVKRNAVPTEVYFNTSAPMQYNIDADGNYVAIGTPDSELVDIFKFSNPGDGELNNLIEWTACDADGKPITDNSLPAYFVYEMDLAAIKEAIQLSQVFILDVKSEHTAFLNALGGNIRLRVTDGTIN